MIVYLPPGYKSSHKEGYPVLYMNDGQNLFDERTSFAGVDWQVDEAIERLLSARELPPLVVVGIYNSPDRFTEYTHTRDPQGRGGAGAAYGKFITEELMPSIESKFRIRPGREHCGVMGSSLGGLVSLYLALTNPDKFSRAGVVSPSIWWGGRSCVPFARTTLESLARKDLRFRIWLDMGTAESQNPARDKVSLESARELRDAILDAGYFEGIDLGYLEAQGATHNEAAWADRLPHSLKFLYGG